MDLSRRGFMAGAACLAGCSAGGIDPEAVLEVDRVGPERWWQGPERARWFRHEAVDTSRVEQGIIRGRIDGAWRDLDTVDLPGVLVQWSMDLRLERLADIARGVFDPRELDGPHNACVATWGGPGRDFPVSLNTAYKGLGFLPRAEVIGALLERIRAATGSLASATGLLAEMYGNPSLFHPRKKVSLELFTEPGFMTHTFLNLMVNPFASASFLALPTYELRAVPQLLHPHDPDLTEEERLQVEYANAVHDLIHAGSTPRIAVVYHVVAVYDDTPGRGGRGARIA